MIAASARKIPITLEEAQRPLRAVQLQHGAEDAKLSRHWFENKPSGRAYIGRLDLGDRQRQFQRVDAELRLDLEPARDGGEGS